MYGFGDPISLLLIVVPIAILITIWILVARTAFIQGDDVERPNRVAQLYGYAVCLVVIVVALTSVSSLVESAFTLSNPLEANDGMYGEASVSSFEAYRATYTRERDFAAPGAPAVRDTLPEPVLRQRYEALRADRIAHNRFQAQRSMTTSALSLIIAIALFLVHWRWLRSRDADLPAVAVRQ
jgi:hypothetical protein